VDGRGDGDPPDSRAGNSRYSSTLSGLRITGYDWIIENGSKVHEVGEFLFSKVCANPRWVLCVRKIRHQVRERPRRQTHRTRSFKPHQEIFKKHGVKAR